MQELAQKDLVRFKGQMTEYNAQLGDLQSAAKVIIVVPL